MNPFEIAGALKETLEQLDVQVYDHVPDSIVPPCLVIFPERVPYDRTQGATFVVWCLSGTVEERGAQELLLTWLGDGEGSIIELIDADNTLGGAVNSVVPLEQRNFSMAPVQDGRPRMVQAELVLDVL